MLSSEAKPKNGFYLDLKAQKNQRYCLKPYGYKFTVTEDTMNGMAAACLKVSREQLQDVMSLLNNHRAIRWHDLSSCWKLCLITVCIFPPAILFGCASAILFVLPRAARNVTTMTTYNSENDEGSLIAACVFACIGITIILGICTCIIGNRKIKKLRKHVEEKLWGDVTVNTYKEGLLFTLVYSYNDRPILRVIRYDVKKCKMYLVGLLKRRQYGTECQCEEYPSYYN